ncbi:MAG: tRNA-dihydrouridine synthase family protein [Myxococcales bacterium]|nr:tRNA-dihydrouridine synthase family protein [Myxococcales bacterium]
MSALTPGHPTSYRVRDTSIATNLVLAPMEGVTDVAFRRALRTVGGTGLVYSEFIASKGIARGDRNVWEVAAFDPEEVPIALQIYGREPELMAEAAHLLEAHGATILDINMGCPAKKVVCHSGGSSLMREPELALAIVRAVRRAVSIPLTVKMRTGFSPDQRNAPELARRFEGEGVDALTVHWRTRDDGYGGTRDVRAIAETVAAVSIPVLGNGDVIDIASADAMFRETGCAGVMIGRGALRNPWCFREIGAWLRGEVFSAPTAVEQLAFIETYVEALLAMFNPARGTEEGGRRRALGKLKQLIKLMAETLPDGDSATNVDGRTWRDVVLREVELEAALAALRTWLGC